MNVIKILWKLGYEVIGIKGNVYTVIVSHDRYKKSKNANIEVEIMKEYELYVSDIGFNLLGNLYVVFSEIDTLETFDMYEYEYISNYDYL